jgi:hypothetical protein
MVHHIIVGCISYGEGTALINCGEDKGFAEELAAELNALVARRKAESPKPCPVDLFDDWKKLRGFEHLKENVLTDKYEVHEVIVVQR